MASWRSPRAALQTESSYDLTHQTNNISKPATAKLAPALCKRKSCSTRNAAGYRITWSGGRLCHAGRISGHGCLCPWSDHVSRNAADAGGCGQRLGLIDSDLTGMLGFIGMLRNTLRCATSQRDRCRHGAGAGVAASLDAGLSGRE